MKYDEIQKVINSFVHEGPFLAAVVASEDGLPVASSVKTGLDQQLAAALAGLVHQTIDRIRNELDLGDVKYILVYSKKGTLVFRSVPIDKESNMIFVALIPRGIRYFKRKISQVVRDIKRVFKQ